MLRRTIPENGRARRCRAESDLLFIRFIKFETSSLFVVPSSPFTKFSAINLFLSYFSGIRTHPSFLGKRSKRELIPLREPLLLPEPRFSISRIRFHGGATGDRFVWSYHAKRLFHRPDGYAAWGVHEEEREMPAATFR